MKIFNGVIVSVGMNNSVSVSVERKVPHPLYGKLMKRNKKFLVDSAGFELTVGDKVEIVETKPISKNKYFKISKAIGKKASVNKPEEVENKKIKKVAKEEKPKAKTVKKTNTRKETK